MSAVAALGVRVGGGAPELDGGVPEVEGRAADDRGPLRRELDRLAERKATGVLRLADAGAFHLTGGAVTFAESTRSTGLDRLLAASGRIGLDEWHLAYETSRGDIDAMVGALGGRISRPELEVRVLVAVFDAAYFLFADAHGASFADAGGPGVARPAARARSGSRPSSRARGRTTHTTAMSMGFSADVVPALEPIWRITPATLEKEVDRRRAHLDEVWPLSDVDELPVVPVRQVPRQRVVLTGLQAELLFNADGHRTPAELARELGRPAFSCLAAVRSLAAAGLLRTAGSGSGSAGRQGARRQHATEPPAPVVESGGPMAEPPPAPATPPARWAPVDEGLLLRLHEALKEFS